MASVKQNEPTEVREEFHKKCENYSGEQKRGNLIFTSRRTRQKRSLRCPSRQRRAIIAAHFRSVMGTHDQPAHNSASSSLAWFRSQFRHVPRIKIVERSENNFAILKWWWGMKSSRRNGVRGVLCLAHYYKINGIKGCRLRISIANRAFRRSGDENSIKSEFVIIASRGPECRSSERDLIETGWRTCVQRVFVCGFECEMGDDSVE